MSYTSTTNRNQDIYLMQNKPVYRGKLYRGAVSTAYNRTSLGSIPSHVENVIFPHPSSQCPKGFLNKSQRFSNCNPTIRVSFPSREYTTDHSAINHSKSTNALLEKPKHNFNSQQKSFGSENRFVRNDLINSKYSPGPGEYKTPQLKNTKALRYQSTFLVNQSQPLMQNDINLGPGSYLYNNDTIQQPLPNIASFLSKAPRFAMSKRETDKDDISGPGLFDYSSTFEIKDGDKVSSFFKRSVRPEGVSQFITEIKMNIDNAILASAHNNNNNNENGEDGNSKVVNPFKYKKTKRPFKDIKHDIPELQRNLLQGNQNYHSTKDITIPKNGFDQQILFKKIIEEEGKYQPQHKAFVISKTIKPSSFDNDKTKHVPGPCYYEQPVLRNKKYFHIPNENLWL